ncbi:CPBP family intramembrane glutamic endopeptidase [Streptomyces buecherae]|uniref:CPBP family intramembrane glutamic endopeptidase n=1 Tax=Streptomyces buecherae TaxID=2763006 RepID=UPI001E52CC3F|nr:type II CAAX endopeptidase family protein [Streptomyces buecherae]
MLTVLLFLLAAVLGVLMVGVIGADVFDVSASTDSDDVFSDPLADTALLFISIAAGLPAVLLAVRRFGRHRPGALSSVTGRFRWQWAGRCAALAFPLYAVQLTLYLAWVPDDSGSPSEGSATAPAWPAIAGALVLVLALVPFQAAAEEYVFRGWLTQFVGRFARSPWPGTVASAVLFACAHGWGSLSGFALLLSSSLWWGMLVVRTGGLEAVVALHIANNMLVLGLATALGELDEADSAATAPWQALVLETTFTPLYYVAITWLARRLRLAGTTVPGQ